MRVWITKYALTDGIHEEEAELCLKTDETGNMIRCTGAAHFAEHFHSEGKDWHRTRESAVTRAEEMRQKKIASLQKQIAKLEKMKFE